MGSVCKKCLSPGFYFHIYPVIHLCRRGLTHVRAARRVTAQCCVLPLPALSSQPWPRRASPGGPARPCGMPPPCPRVIWALLHFSLQAHLAFSLTQGTQVPVIGESHWEIEMWAPGVTDAPGMPLLLPLLADRGRTWGNAHGHAYLQFLVIHPSSSALS